MKIGTLFVILGWEPAAAYAAHHLLSRGMEIVVVNTDNIFGLPAGVLLVKGEEDDERTLRAASVHHAAGILCCLAAEKARRALAVVHRLNPAARVVASLQHGDSKAALYAGGAQSVLDAREETAREMARLMFADRHVRGPEAP